MIRQWFDDTALSWAKEGIDATEAQLWQELGLKAAEAGRLTRQGATLFQTVRDWWRAGIPIDEVAEWIGAGLKPDEAADQRARGITPTKQQPSGPSKTNRASPGTSLSTIVTVGYQREEERPVEPSSLTRAAVTVRAYLADPALPGPPLEWSVERGMTLPGNT